MRIRKLNKKQNKLIHNLSQALLTGLVPERDLVLIRGEEFIMEYFIRCERCGKKMLVTCSPKEFEDEDGLFKCSGCMRECRKQQLQKRRKKATHVHKTIWDHR